MTTLSGGSGAAWHHIPVPRRETWGRWLRESPSALMPLALLVGAVSGAGAIVFRWLITAFTRMFTG